MLQVFFGTNQIKARQHAHLAIEAELGPDKEFIRLEPDSYEVGSLLNHSSATSLFSTGTVYLVDSPFLRVDFYADLMNSLEALASSNNLFVVILEEITATDKKKFSKHTTVIEEFKKTTETSFSPFKMADALCVKDKRSLWLLFQEAKQNSLSAEEIIGTLWWQLKTIRVAAATNSAAEAGVKEYPYKKAKSALRAFPLSDVEKQSRRLLKLYHESHRGKRDLDLALEQWILSI